MFRIRIMTHNQITNVNLRIVHFEIKFFCSIIERHVPMEMDRLNVALWFDAWFEFH